MIPINKGELISEAIKRLSHQEAKYILSKIPKSRGKKRTANATKKVYAWNVICEVQIIYDDATHAAKALDCTTKTIYNHVKTGKPFLNRKLSYYSFIGARENN